MYTKMEFSSPQIFWFIPPTWPPFWSTNMAAVMSFENDTNTCERERVNEVNAA